MSIFDVVGDIKLKASLEPIDEYIKNNPYWYRENLYGFDIFKCLDEYECKSDFIACKSYNNEIKRITNFLKLKLFLQQNS